MSKIGMDDKAAILQQIEDEMNKAFSLERAASDEAQAKLFHEKGEALSKEHDRLFDLELEAWSGESIDLLSRIDTSAEQLNEDLEAIRQGLAKAEHLVSALGKLDNFLNELLRIKPS